MRVVFFCSRNKDNKDVFHFVPRNRAFVMLSSQFIKEEFNKFVNEGQPGELSRCYISVNERDEEKVRKGLLHRLIDGNVDLTYIEPVIASIAAKAECAVEHKWLFDFDSLDVDKLDDFIHDINDIDPLITVEYSRTINGFYVITDHGFDTRKLLEKWGKIVENKRDGSKLLYWKTKE